MIVEKELKKIFRQLLQEDIVKIDVDGFNITVRIFDQASKLSLSTPVYFGGNYIPKSVRNSLSKSVGFSSSHIKAFTSIDENNFQINLNYLGRLNVLNNESFRDLLEDFSGLASEWRNFLDEHDKNDLVHVRVK